MLRYSILDIIILQRLQLLKTPVIRYQLMKKVFVTSTTKNIPISKFYYSLSRLRQSGLVADYTDDEGNRLYFLTKKGLQVLSQLRLVLGQVGFSVMTYFSPYLPQIITFVKSDISPKKDFRVLFIDVPELHDVELLATISNHVEELHLLLPKEAQLNLPMLGQAVKVMHHDEGFILAPNEHYEIVILFYPTIGKFSLFLKELHRVLRPQGFLVLIDAENPLDENRHFMITILIETFWPLPMKDKKDVADIVLNLQNQLQWRSMKSLVIDGLILHRFEK